MRFEHAAAGPYHNLGLTSNSQVYVFGQNAFGVLGCGDNKQEDVIAFPRLNRSLWALGVSQVRACSRVMPGCVGTLLTTETTRPAALNCLWLGVIPASGACLSILLPYIELHDINSTVIKVVPLNTATPA